MSADPSDEPKSTAESDAKLAPHRERIDAIDRELVSLLNERAREVIEIGRIKRARDAPIYAPDRESRVLEQIRLYNQGPLPDACLEAIWREMMSGSFALERPLRIGYLGPEGTFSHLAATRKFGASVEYDNLADIRMIFDAVVRRHIDYGLVPIENSTEGSVTVTLDCLIQVQAPCSVCAEVLVAIHQNLLANCDPPQIRRIYSHPQGLAQCRQWLNAQFPRVERVETSSTARAVEIAATEPYAAAIGSALAARLFNVHLQFENIEDNPNNTTRFLIIGRQEPGPTGDDKTSLVFTTEHKAGALTRVLNVFKDHGLNLTHIDKRPSQQVNWEYYFFVDVEGHRHHAQVQDAIHAARAHCLSLNVLGAFPRAREAL